MYRIEQNLGKPLSTTRSTPKQAVSQRPVTPATAPVRPKSKPGAPRGLENTVSKGAQSNQPYSMEELTRLMHEQDASIVELRRTVEILTLKNSKLEQLVKIKDKKIQVLSKH